MRIKYKFKFVEDGVTTREFTENLSHGIQLWTALPDAYRNSLPSFDHYADLPEVNFHGCVAKVMAGKIGNVESPVRVFSPIVGAEFFAELDCRIEVPVQPEFEHALFLIYGYAEIYDLRLNMNTLYYLGTKRKVVELLLSKGTVLILLGVSLSLSRF